MVNLVLAITCPQMIREYKIVSATHGIRATYHSARQVSPCVQESASHSSTVMGEKRVSHLSPHHIFRVKMLLRQRRHYNGIYQIFSPEWQQKYTSKLCKAAIAVLSGGYVDSECTCYQGRETKRS